MRFTILGKRWEFCRKKKVVVEGEAVDGSCDGPSVKGKKIIIDDSLSGQRELEVLIHEMIHASGWHIDHSYINQFSSDVARILTKLGYKRGE